MTEFKKTLIALAKEYDLPYSVVEQLFNSQFEFTKETIESFDAKEMTIEEINNTKTNFNYKYLGKLYAATNNIKRFKKGEDESKFQTKDGDNLDNSELSPNEEE